jgi:hypothetical protein
VTIRLKSLESKEKVGGEGGMPWSVLLNLLPFYPSSFPFPCPTPSLSPIIFILSLTVSRDDSCNSDVAFYIGGGVAVR